MREGSEVAVCYLCLIALIAGYLGGSGVRPGAFQTPQAEELAEGERGRPKGRAPPPAPGWEDRRGHLYKLRNVNAGFLLP